MNERSKTITICIFVFLFFFGADSFKSSFYAKVKSSFPLFAVTKAPFDDIIPFLSEHIQPSDHLLFLGASTDLSIQLSKAGFGTKLTGFMLVVDDDSEVKKNSYRRLKFVTFFFMYRHLVNVKPLQSLMKKLLNT